MAAKRRTKMSVEIIDISDDIDRLGDERARHRELALKKAMTNMKEFVKRQELPLVSAPAGSRVPVRLPLVEEYRFHYAFPPFDGGGEGVGQSSLEQGDKEEEGEDSWGKGSGEDEGGEEGQEEGSSGRKPGEKREEPGGGTEKERLKRGMEIGKFDPQEGREGAGSLGFGRDRGNMPGFSMGDDQGGEEAGQGEGEHTFDTDLPIDDLRRMLAGDFNLPELDPKFLRSLKKKLISRPHGVRRKGPHSQLKRRVSAKENIKREDGDEDEDFIPEDMRYGRKGVEIKELTDAVIFFIKDASGSINDLKLRVMLALAVHLIDAVRRVHKKIHLVFIIFDEKGQEADEVSFLTVTSSGGTAISSGPIEALRLIEEKWKPELYNLFAMIFSDGENFSSDNQAMDRAFREFCRLCTLVSYFEIFPSRATHTSAGQQIVNDYTRILDSLGRDLDNFVAAVVAREEEVSKAFEALIEKTKDMKRRVHNG